MPESVRIGIDVGGTFTDLVIQDEAGDISVIKVPSTPDNPANGVMDALQELVDTHDVVPGDIDAVFHGTTVAMNAAIEEEGAKTGLLTTEGYNAVPVVGTQSRPETEIFNAFDQEKSHLIPPKRTMEVTERLDEQGNVIQPLAEDDVRAAVRDLRDEDVEAISVCYLFSFINPSHEERTREIINEEYPECFVSISSEVVPKIREYPRLSTTSIDAYVGPVLEDYLDDLRTRIDEFGIETRKLYLMLSNGGLAPLTSENKDPSQTLFSGPAGGVQGSSHIGDLIDAPNLVTMDMGGTSCDISIVKDGDVTRTTEGSVRHHPIAHPHIDIATIGAGGGTQARVEGNRLLVGPKSSGAVPGPICYGRGGEVPTITDANVLLRRLNPDYLLGGELEVEFEKAKNLMREQIADLLEMDVIEASSGIIEIINNKMKKEINLTLNQYGYDPRKFTLFAYGGAGPSHAAMVADMLDMPRVVIPPWPGLHSAVGLLANDIRQEYSLSRIQAISSASTGEIVERFETLEEEAIRDRSSEGFASDEVTFERELDLRYEQQGYELTIGVSSDFIDKDRIRREFDDLHEKRFGHKSDEPIETVNYRVVSTVEVPKAGIGTETAASEAKPSTDYRDVYYPDEGAFVESPVYDSRPVAGEEFVGPLVIERVDTTIVVEPGQVGHVDRYGNTIIEVNQND